MSSSFKRVGSDGPLPQLVSTQSIIPTFVSPVIRRDTLRPSLCYLDMTFMDAGGGSGGAAELEAIVFQNYYTASISINMQTSPTTFTSILENRSIMPNPHCETGAQTWVTINASEFQGKYEKGRSLRITLIQPATVWNTFEIRNCCAIAKVSSPLASSSSLDVNTSSIPPPPISATLRALAGITSNPTSSSSPGSSSGSGLASLFRQDLSALKSLTKERQLLLEQQKVASKEGFQQESANKVKPTRRTSRGKKTSSSFSLPPPA